MSVSEKGVIAWMARNSVAANLLLLLVVVSGMSALFSIKREVFPSFPADSLTVTVPYPGSSPEEVEEGVLIKIEEAIQDLPNIRKITADASEGSGRVTVQFEAGSDYPDLFNKVKVRVDGISNWPLDAESPRIEENFSRSKVIRLSLYGPVSEKELRTLADELRDDLLATGKITQVEFEGARDYEISIELSESALRQYHLRFDDVLQVLRAQSQNLPGGRLRGKDQTITLRSEGQAYNRLDYERLVLLSRPDGTRVLLGDVATIRDGFTDQKILSLFNGYPGITLRVDRMGNQDALEVSDLAREIAKNKQATLSQGIEIRSWSDSSETLRGRIDLLLRNAAQGSVLVLLVLALFLRPTLAFWVVVGIPFCVFGALSVMEVLGLSINVLSLFAFILVMGILVDDAIVTAESAYTTLEEEDEGVESIIRGVKKVSVATIFGVLTTVIAFMPMLFLTEGISRFFTVVAAVVMSCLLFSIVESKLILPTHLRHLSIQPPIKSRWRILNWFQKIQQRSSAGLQNFAVVRYQPVLHWCLRNRYIAVALFLCFLLLITALVKAGMIRQIFFPNVPSDYITVSLEMPEGTPAQVTQDYARRIADAAESLNERFRIESGRDVDVIENLLVLSESDTQAKVQAALLPSTERTITSVQMGSWWREKLGELAGVKAISFDVNAGHFSAPIDVQLTARSIDSLQKAAQEVQLLLHNYDGVHDIRDTFDAGVREVDIQITSQGKALGLGQAELARQVRQAFFGEEVQRIQRGRHEVRVYLRFPENERTSLDNVQKMWIHLVNGDEVPFSVVGRIEEKTGISTIKRIDRQRVVSVQADVDKAMVEPNKILDALRPQLDELQSHYPDLRYRFAGDRENQDKDQGTLWIKSLIMLMMIYAALAVPLKSYGQPLIIMSVIPFGIAGAYLGHGLMGMEVSVLSTVGIVALAGIVVNDSLVLVDYINQQTRAGVSYLEAVANAGPRRFRAVILTSTTTFVGLLPLQLETSIQAQFLKPMATSVAFGVLFATVVTLLFVPVLCYIIVDVKAGLKRLFKSVPASKSQ